MSDDARLIRLGQILEEARASVGIDASAIRSETSLTRDGAAELVIWSDRLGTARARVSVFDESDVLFSLGGIDWELSNGTPNLAVWDVIRALLAGVFGGEITQSISYRGDVVVAAVMRLGRGRSRRTWRYGNLVGPLGKRGRRETAYERY